MRFTESVVTVRYRNLAVCFTKLALPAFLAAPLAAQTPLLEVFAACEASVLEDSDYRLREVGSLIDESNLGSRIRVDTPLGTVLAMHIPSERNVSACLLWGREPNLEIEFQEQWQDWVEWEEAVVASEAWFKDAVKSPGNNDLTDHTQPGYVVARCSALEHGVVLASQPMVANTARMVLPKFEPIKERVVHYQFSVVSALPGRCSAAVEAHKANN